MKVFKVNFQEIEKYEIEALVEAETEEEAIEKIKAYEFTATSVERFSDPEYKIRTIAEYEN